METYLRTKAIQNLGPYLGLFLIFFIISLGLGYAVLNRYDPVALIALHDLSVYAEIVKHGPATHIGEQISVKGRLLAPGIAHLIYLILPPMGSYNAVSAAMLIANSAFTALSAVLIFQLTYHFFENSQVSLIACFTFISNFFVTNSYLVGGIDAAYGCMFLILFYVIIHDRWSLLPIIMVAGCLTKEAFLPVASAIVLFVLISHIRSLDQLHWQKIWLFITMMLSGAVTVSAMNFIVFGSIAVPWEMLTEGRVAPTLPSFKDSELLVNLISNLLRFFLTLGVIFLLALFSLRHLPRWFVAGNLGALLITFLLATYMTLGGTEISGADYARFMFSPMALILSSASAQTLSKLMQSIRE